MSGSWRATHNLRITLHSPQALKEAEQKRKEAIDQFEEVCLVDEFKLTPDSNLSLNKPHQLVEETLVRMMQHIQTIAGGVAGQCSGSGMVPWCQDKAQLDAAHQQQLDSHKACHGALAPTLTLNL